MKKESILVENVTTVISNNFIDVGNKEVIGGQKYTYIYHPADTNFDSD